MSVLRAGRAGLKPCSYGGGDVSGGFLDTSAAIADHLLAMPDSPIDYTTQDAIGASPGRSAILFGPERSGLETEDVALANAIVTVPINPDFGSLNLAQAVILLAYEWSKRSALAQPPAKELEPVAPHGELDGLIDQLDEALVDKGYFHPPSRTQATRNTIRTIFTKAGWSSREIKAVRGIFRALTGPARRR